jgi:hypothetical protein
MQSKEQSLENKSLFLQKKVTEQNRAKGVNPKMVLCSPGHPTGGEAVTVLLNAVAC